MSGIASIYSHMDRGANTVAGVPIYTDFLHQLIVANANVSSVYFCAYAAPGKLLHAGYTGIVNCKSVSLLERAGNRMVGVAFRQSRNFKQIRLGNFVGMDCSHVEHASGERAGFVKHNYLGIGKRFKIVAALDQNAVFGRAAYAAEKAKRNRYDQRARAGNNEKDKRAVNPVGPAAAENQRRQYREQNGADYNAGGIIT